jgi:hypothetical protein
MQAAAIFNTIPSHDYLHLLEDNASKKVVDFLQLTKEDVAKATGLPKASIRYDARIPNELVQRLQEIGVICELVAEHFKGDIRKTVLWFQIKNPALGNISPRDMIRYGRYQKLVKFVQNALAGNTP